MAPNERQTWKGKDQQASTIGNQPSYHPSAEFCIYPCSKLKFIVNREIARTLRRIIKNNDNKFSIFTARMFMNSLFNVICSRL